jgi:hypothetical protein
VVRVGLASAVQRRGGCGHFITNPRAFVGRMPLRIYDKCRASAGAVRIGAVRALIAVEVAVSPTAASLPPQYKPDPDRHLAETCNELLKSWRCR